ncbi:MAG: hypothetical protein NVSMB70_17990 [Chamaesiphon sp.]
MDVIKVEEVAEQEEPATEPENGHNGNGSSQTLTYEELVIYPRSLLVKLAKGHIDNRKSKNVTELAVALAGKVNQGDIEGIAPSSGYSQLLTELASENGNSKTSGLADKVTQ